MAQLDPQAKELEQQLDGVEKRVERLRSLYEQYFQGIERMEPSMERTSLHNLIQELRHSKVRSTGLRFRINQVVSRMNTYENYWNRIMRQMEAGTYHRDVFKARYRSRLKAETHEAVEEKTKEQTQEKSPAEAVDKRRPDPSPPAAGIPRGLSDEKIKAITDTYLLAKRRCREPTRGITQDAIASSLRKQIPNIMKRYNCKSVEFKVVIKKGKAILKAVPKF
ncbi:MAG TPA: MXAN_5187 C-terminal domain-containing protein [Myxococcota bacterium]|nr:MXAN_5187 C-terminal domain-containing protein [Myxococcota bacterium]